MANYFQYQGIGGVQNGTLYPSGGTVQVGETLCAMTQLPDNREGIQNGVRINCFAWISTTSAAGTATVLCRQSTLGTSALTGNALGTYYAAVPVGSNQYYDFEFTDLTGTYPIPAYQFTMNLSAGTATVLQSRITVSPNGE